MHFDAASAPRHHHLLDLADRLGRVQVFRAGAGAVHDGVAAVEAERVLEVVEAFAGGFVAAVDQPAVGLQQDRRAKELVRIPPPKKRTPFRSVPSVTPVAAKTTSLPLANSDAR